MEYLVNERCVGCGLCVGICPECFEMDQDGLAEAVADPEGGDTAQRAREAMQGCPVAAIEKKH